MQMVRRRRTSWAVAASIAAHLGLLTAALLQKPVLRAPVEPGGPPEAIIPLLIMPKVPAPAAGHGERPAPIHLHRRQLRNLPPPPTVAPLVAPSAPPAEAAPRTPAPVVIRPAPEPAAVPPDAVRATLRATLGCSEARIAGVTREDRTGCLDRLGRGAREAAYLPPALSPEKRAALQQAGDAKMAQKTIAGRAISAARARFDTADYDGEPYIGDDGQGALGPVEHKPSKRAAAKLGPLPP